MNTSTGRLSSANPNLQNIPVRNEEGKELRKIFIAGSGNVLVDADYSQIELRLLAHFSGCKELIEAYREHKDIHSITASQVFGVPVEQVSPQMRRSAKAVNFGIIYGISSFGLGRDLGISAKRAKEYIDKYFETYDANDKAYALFDKLQDYTIFTTDNSNCVSLFEWLNSVRVIDLTLYPDDTKKVIVSLILDLFYAEMRQLGGSKQEDGYRELRAMIMVDEAHQFLKKDFNSFRSIISEGRMFGVGMILSTQNISDFKTAQEDYSQFILSWVIHHVNSISKAEIASIFGASDPNGERYMDFINKAKLFESVCKIGSKVDGIRDLPFFELVQKDDRFKNDN